QGEEGRLQPAFVRVAERDQRAPPALDEQGGLAAEQNDPGAGDAGGSRPRSLRPRQRGPVGLCRVSSRENEHVRLIAFARSELAQPFDCAAECELGAAEALDKVAAPAEAERLERLQLAVNRRVATRDPLRAYTVARDDSLPLEQQLRERPPIRTGPGTWSRDRAEEAFRSRPAALRRRDLAGPVAREAPRPPLRLRHPVAASGSQRLPGVVRDLAGPDEIPKRGQRLLGLEPRLRQQVEPEQGVSVKRLAQAVVELAFGPIGAGHLPQHGCVLAEIDGNAIEAGADPHDLAGRAELVQLRSGVAGHAARQHLGLPERDRQRQRLQRHERLAQRRPAVDPMPARQEASQRGLLGGLDFLPQRGQRCAPQSPEDVGVAPLALHAAGPQLAADEELLALELVQDPLDVDPEALVRLSGREWTASLRIAQHQPAQRLFAAFEVDVR